MKQTRSSNIYRYVIIVLGLFCFGWALYKLPAGVFGAGYILLLVLAVLFSIRFSFTLPYSKVALSFSDTLILLSFLYFGIEAAVILTTFEMLTSCIHLRLKNAPMDNQTILFNTFSSAFTTTVSVMVLKVFQNALGINYYSGNTFDLICILSILALTQFAVSSTLAVLFHFFKDRSNPIRLWDKVCLPYSVTYISAAILAGIIYILFNNAAYINIAVAVGVYIVFYISFRQTINTLNDSINKADVAERERMDAEKKRVEEAEKNLTKFNSLFEEQEKISRALQQSKEALERSAYFDAMTGIFNRKYLIERLELLLDLGINIANHYYVLFLDLSRFKNINDSLGHPVGDKVLQMVAHRLRRILREEDTIARLGGDEFAIILNDLADPEDAEKFARRIHKKLAQPYSIEGHKVFTDLHIGISPLDREHLKPEDVLRDADIAMHYAKEQKMPIAFFTKELRERFLETVKLETELRFALKRNEFQLHYQPVVLINKGTLVGFESLLRWQHPKYGFISPGQFIPIAEESGLIIPMTDWILRKSCQQLAEWQKISPECRHLRVSVNISGKHLGVEDLPDTVQAALNEAQIHPSSLILEITESSAMKDVERTIKILEKLRKIGVSVSIDDFGTGYSSLSYLHRLPFDSLKIDRSFVINLEAHRENYEILQTIVLLAKNLKLRTVAEGIETEKQLYMMQDLGCDLGQGFLFSKPLPKEEIENMLRQQTHWIPLAEPTVGDANLTHDISADNRHIF